MNSDSLSTDENGESECDHSEEDDILSQKTSPKRSVRGCKTFLSSVCHVCENFLNPPSTKELPELGDMTQVRICKVSLCSAVQFHTLV